MEEEWCLRYGCERVEQGLGLTCAGVSHLCLLVR
jgi:hypothetical protein